MPPIQQQQTSRAGLITSLVVTIMVALGFMIWGIMMNSDRNKTQLELTKAKETMKSVWDPDSQEAKELTELQKAERAGSRATLLDLAARERSKVVRLVTGKDGSVKDAETAMGLARAAVEGDPRLAEQMKSLIVKTDNSDKPGTLMLAEAVKTLVGKVKDDAEASAQAVKTAESAKAAAEAAAAKAVAEAATNKTAASTAQTATSAADKRATDEIAAKQTQVEENQKKVEEAQKALVDAQTQAQAREQQLGQEIKKLSDERQKALDLLARYRPNVKEATVRNIDCRITQLAEHNACYIDLGYGDHVVPGLTFEVYDRLDGVPPLAVGTSNFDLPKGKASIEIIEVGQNSSRCRVLVVRPGQQLSQGDVCANIVYDKNIKPTFFVYGSFDMDNNGVATPGEADVIKNLINRWGGRVVDKLGTEVDFVIVGKEPVVPNYTEEEKQTAVIKQRFDEAKKQQDDYNAIVLKAGELHIPTMNQDRFLYYCGYFDASKN